MSGSSKAASNQAPHELHLMNAPKVPFGLILKKTNQLFLIKDTFTFICFLMVWFFFWYHRYFLSMETKPGNILRFWINISSKMLPGWYWMGLHWLLTGDLTGGRTSMQWWSWDPTARNYCPAPGPTLSLCSLLKDSSSMSLCFSCPSFHRWKTPVSLMLF